MTLRLDDVVSRYEELTRELSDPSVSSNPSRLRDLGKQHAELGEIVQTHAALQEAERQAEEAHQLARDERDPEMAEYLKAEQDQAEHRAAGLREKLEVLLLPKDPNDEKNVVLEIRAGPGGQEAALFAGDLFEMYRRYAERQGWKTDVLSSSPSDLGGFKEVVVEIRGKGAYSKMKHESGVHRVQRIPVTESGGRIHTSTATVAVLPEAEEVDVAVDPNDLDIQVYRSSGPGGQSVNTTDSAVRITHRPSGIKVEVQEERSQLQNKEKAMRYLRARLLKLAQDQAHAAESAARKAQVGTGDRSEKIRTYNYPQNRVTDHRVEGLSSHNLPSVMEGNLDHFVEELAAAERRRRLTGDDDQGVDAVTAGPSTAQVLRRSADYLARHGVESPRETAEALMMHVLDTDRAGLYSGREGLDARKATLLGRALCRRCSGTPLQYLTGEQRFMGLDLAVEPGVFVPRPETEGLVMAALETIAAVRDPVVVDAGTGTGAVALAVKARRPDARVVATDRSAPAVRLARSNAARLGLAVDVRQGDLLTPVPPALRGRVDLLVSNPPYVAPEDFDALPQEVKAEPYEALVGGTEVHARLGEAARSWLRPGGWLVTEIGETQAQAVLAIIGSGPAAEVLTDLAGRDRVIKARFGDPG